MCCFGRARQRCERVLRVEHRLAGASLASTLPRALYGVLRAIHLHVDFCYNQEIRWCDCIYRHAYLFNFPCSEIGTSLLAWGMEKVIQNV